MDKIIESRISKIKEECEKIKPLVVIHSLTYNHGTYIRESLEGFIRQKTSFPFVAIIHDDASSDNTSDIIKQYAEAYPDIIKPIFEKDNQYSKPGNPLVKIMLAAINATGAEYIAWCEGDDYWTDETKLQKQVDFLNNHPDYSMCFHEAEIINETNQKFTYPNLENRSYTPVELFKNWIVPTASIMSRKTIIDKRPIDKDFISGDIVLVLTAAALGKVYGMSAKMSAYRVQNNGATISRVKQPLKFYQAEAKHLKALYKHFPEITLHENKRKLSNTYINLGMTYLRKAKISGMKYLIKAFIYSPKNFFIRIYNLLNKK